MDSPQEWPEPIVHVQTLSESGMAVIPDRYVKPPSDRPSMTSEHDGDHGIAPPGIPVIDLGGLAGSVAECRATIEAIAAACRDWGFFQVVNHGISREHVDGVMEGWKGFFHLPAAAKEVYRNSPATYEGYGSRLGIKKGAKLDWGDYYFLHLRPSRSHDKFWPMQPSSCSVVMEEYGREAVKLCKVLMKAMSIGLGLEVEQLQKEFGGDQIGACTRANYYPRCPQPELTLGLSSHSDPGGLTVLLVDDSTAGLQVRRGDRWVNVRPVAPGALIVNVGDQIQVLTNGMFKSVEHRVVASGATDRLSVAFFYNPRSDLPLGPIAALVSPDQPPLYRPMTFSEYRMHIRTKGPTGKTQVESLKAV